MAATADGAVLVGSFRGTLAAGSSRVVGRAEDGHVAGLDSAGRPRWIVAVGGPGIDGATAVAAGPSGAVAVVGFVGDEANLDGQRIGGRGQPAGYLAVLGPDGRRRLAIAMPASGWVLPRAVAVGPDGDLAVAGQFGGALELGQPSLPDVGGGDGFVARFSSAGALRWVRRFGGPGADLAAAIAFLPDGRLAVGGQVAPGDDLGAHPGGRATPAALVLLIDPAGEIAAGALPARGAAQVAAVAPWQGGLAVGGADDGDALVALLDLSAAGTVGAIRWSTRLGPGRVTALAGGRALAVAGVTDDRHGGTDGYVALVGPDGATRRDPLGGRGDDAVTGLAWTAAGDLLVAGTIGGRPHVARL